MVVGYRVTGGSAGMRIRNGQTKTVKEPSSLNSQRNKHSPRFVARPIVPVKAA